MDERRCKICGSTDIADYNSWLLCREHLNARLRQNSATPAQIAHRKAWRKSNENRLLELVRFRKFGMLPGDYDKMLESQGGVCAICRETCSSGRRLAVDHCHETHKIRGLLCGNCNNGIGRLKHSEALLASAIEYLKS